MGNKKKGYNWKSRQVVDTVIDNTETKKIELEGPFEGSYDQNNALVLPSKKRHTKVKKDANKFTKILSKKQRKRLEKVVEKKKKKENRNSLLEALCQVQATPEELSGLTSIISIQNKGLKRYFQEEQAAETVTPLKTTADAPQGLKLNSISGSKRRRLALIEKDEPEKSSDLNVVGFDSSSSEGSGESEVEDVPAEIKTETIEDSEMVVDNDKKSQEEGNCSENVSLENDEKQKNDVTENVKPSVQPVKVKEEVVRKPAVYVSVDRKPSIQKARLKLPILAEEQQIMEKINESPVLILAGETGSGKTTQVPQFLYEAGFALEKQIGVTEPRRVAAISMSQRVAEEMNLSAREVSYLIRFEGNVTDDTKIKFMTDGVLLKEVQTDFLLNKYSVIILDEAHERSVYTDILIGLLSRIVPLRQKRGNPLKLIIMSATLRLEDFTENKRLFKAPPPVIKVDARQFPVTVHFNKRTNENYLKEAYNKAIKVHTKLPDGGILIFLTGQQEVNSLVRKLRRRFPLKHNGISKTCGDVKKESGDDSDADVDDNLDDALNNKKRRKKKRAKVVPQVNLDDYGLPGDIEDLHSDDEYNTEDDADSDVEMGITPNAQPLWVLPLYSLLPSYKQAKVFQPPPPDTRLCIISTNVAETSLTIPNVKYVIDTGKTKVKLYDKVTGVTSYMVTWTSKASADQRAGRAGRTGPGHCYRLYSSAIFNDTFQLFSVPEIQQKPVDDLYLQMKCMNIDKVVNFPFPTAPDLLQLRSAEHRLKTLNALDGEKSAVTPLGRAISKFPVLPRFGKMLALSHQHDLLPYTICLVAALSVQEVLLETPIGLTSSEEIKELRQRWFSKRHLWAGLGNSLLLGDPIVLLKAVGSAEYANSQGQLEKYCQDTGLRHKAVLEIRKLRIQLTNEIKTNVPDSEIVVDPKCEPPSYHQIKLLRQVLLAGLGDHVAKRVMPDEIKEGEDRAKYKYAYHANNMEDLVYFHRSSVLKKVLPEFVIYQEIYETNKMYMRGITAIEPDWLPVYVPALCNLGEPLTDPAPRYDPLTGKVMCTVTGTFGQQAWILPPVEIEYPNGLDAYKWFAQFLLEGQVYPKLKKYRGSLLSQPSTMIKSWARLQPRTEVLLKVLAVKEVRSKSALKKAWEDNPKYLLPEYLQWVPESAHNDVTLCWPPLLD